MESLYDLLAGRNFDEPAEVALIKKFIRDNYRAEAGVSVRERDIIVTVSSAPLAGKLRYDMQRLKEAAATKKHITLRIQH